ncbi:MAG: DinB family protein [Cytophagaceae bacterium]|nr:DinB family protein [Cytophagaceae bacterium]
MKKLLTVLFFLGLSITSFSQNLTLKKTLLDQIRSTHHGKNWFVSIDVALQGVTAEQANWHDNSGNHSIGQLTSHLVFWNERILRGFRNETPEKFSGNNEESFTKFEKESWEKTLKKLSEIMLGLEAEIEKADDEKLVKIAETVANTATHNAYHTGQIIFARKLQGSWNPENGVK